MEVSSKREFNARPLALVARPAHLAVAACFDGNLLAVIADGRGRIEAELAAARACNNIRGSSNVIDCIRRVMMQVEHWIGWQVSLSISELPDVQLAGPAHVAELEASCRDIEQLSGLWKSEPAWSHRECRSLAELEPAPHHHFHHFHHHQQQQQQQQQQQLTGRQLMYATLRGSQIDVHNVKTLRARRLPSGVLGSALTMAGPSGKYYMDILRDGEKIDIVLESGKSIAENVLLACQYMESSVHSERLSWMQNYSLYGEPPKGGDAAWEHHARVQEMPCTTTVLGSNLNIVTGLAEFVLHYDSLERARVWATELLLAQEMVMGTVVHVGAHAGNTPGQSVNFSLLFLQYFFPPTVLKKKCTNPCIPLDGPRRPGLPLRLAYGVASAGGGAAARCIRAFEEELCQPRPPRARGALPRAAHV